MALELLLMLKAVQLLSNSSGGNDKGENHISNIGAGRQLERLIDGKATPRATEQNDESPKWSNHLDCSH